MITKFEVDKVLELISSIRDDVTELNQMWYEHKDELDELLIKKCPLPNIEDLANDLLTWECIVQDKVKERHTQGYLVDIAVLDSNAVEVYYYTVDSNFTDESIEALMIDKGHKLGECNWAVFKEIHDYRDLKH